MEKNIPLIIILLKNYLFFIQFTNELIFKSIKSNIFKDVII